MILLTSSSPRRVSDRFAGAPAVIAALVAAAVLFAFAPAASAGPAVFSAQTPAPGSSTTLVRPPISVRVASDATLLGTPQTWVRVDGALQSRVSVAYDRRADGTFDYTRATVSCTLRADLAQGPHTVQVSVMDVAGTRTTTSWAFTVGSPPQLSAPSPAPGATVATTTPAVTVRATGGTTGLVALATVDGAPAPASFDPGTGLVTVGLAGPLANDAVHAVAVTVTNANGLSADLAWSFYVLTQARMTGAGLACTACHALYPDAHPMTECWACHGYGGPVGGFWAPPDGHFEPWEPAYYLSECADCHRAGYPTVPDHGDEVAVHKATSASASCYPCHVSDLLAEHYYRASANSCTLCHASARPEVAAAIAAGDAECAACHTVDLNNHGFSAERHTADLDGQGLSGTWTYVDTNAQVSGVYMNVPYVYTGVVCLNCHTALIAGPSGEHSKPSASTAAAGCSACHPSPRNTFGTWDKTCYACHPQATLHTASSLSAAHSLADPNPSDAGSCGFVSPTNGRRPCHYSDIVQEHNRKINPTVSQPNKVLSVTCQECHTHAATLAAVADGWDGTCTDCHDGTALPNHTVEGTTRYTQVHALHDNPGGYYDAGYNSSTGTRVAGYNAMDAHGPVRPNPSGGANQTIGCGAPTCHTQAYIGGGWPYGTGPACSECHGPNVAPVQPYQGDYAWYSDTWFDGQTLTTRLTMTLDPIVLPAGSLLEFKTFYDIERDWDYGYVEISTNGGASWTRLPGNITTNTNPYGQNLGNGITGSSGGRWVDGRFDLSAYAGQTVRIRFSYLADYYVYGQGWMLDVISVGPAGSPVFYDDVETPNSAWTVTLDPVTGVGWRRYKP
jgi:hypothetical protein